MSPLDALALPGPIECTTLELTQQDEVTKLRDALDNIHKAVATNNAKTSASGRKAKNKSDSAVMVRLDVGDFVLYADVWVNTRTKLSSLITGEHRSVHSSRLKFYADASLNVTEDLLQHIAHNSEGHVVDELRGV
ncbi:hypothetical protein PInf_024605 [Phytophthora infestans]|nr:hypothetical protein PInf_024605 [Phytophthora infestans]